MSTAPTPAKTTTSASGLTPKSALPGAKDLFKASVAGDLNRVKELVEGPVARMNVNDPWVEDVEVDDGYDVQQNKHSALVGAAGHGRTEVVDYLLSKGAKDFNDAVVSALEGRKYQIAETIFNHPKYTALDMNALKHLFKYGPVDLVRSQVEKRNIDVTQIIDKKIGSPIFVALEQPNVAVIEYLINEKNVDPNSQNKLGQSVLLKIALSLLNKGSHDDYTKIVSTLLKKGAKPTESYSDQFWEKQDILDVVCARGPDAKQIISLLLDAGAPVTSPRGRVHELAHHEETGESMQIFLDRGAKVDERNSKGHLPIHVAAIGCQMKNIEFLVSKCGADVNALTSEGKTSVDLAGSNKDVVELLTKLGGKKSSALAK